MEVEKRLCPRCGASDKNVRKHGRHLGKQRYYCTSCGLAFTGSQYTLRPEHALNIIKAENKKALKCLEAARRMNVALDAYLTNGTGKALSRLNVTRTRFVRLLADIPQVEFVDIHQEEEPPLFQG